MFKHSVSLKQHTPLIHFQNEPGATLRATELKPKLDKHLLENCQIIDEWRKSRKPKEKAYKALDYRVRVKAQNVEPAKIEKKASVPAFFANMGDDYDTSLRYFSFSSGPLMLEFTSFYEDLVLLIKSHISAFFARHNFGTRQSKGYGSFYISPTDKVCFKPIDRNWFDYSFQSNSGNYQDCLKDIDLFHKIIRGGINFGGVYAKSLLFCYFRSAPLNIQWGKRKIKEEFFSVDGYARGGRYKGYQTQKREYNSDVLDHQGRKEHMVRDLLGLSTTESWRYYDDTISKKIEGIDRYKSPILYKPVRDGNQFKVWILLNESNDLTGKIIQVHSQKEDKSFGLSTPGAFSITDYFHFLSQVDMQSHLSANKETGIVRSLVRIFNTLSKS